MPPKCDCYRASCSGIQICRSAKQSLDCAPDNDYKFVSQAVVQMARLHSFRTIKNVFFYTRCLMLYAWCFLFFQEFCFDKSANYENVDANSVNTISVEFVSYPDMRNEYHEKFQRSSSVLR